MLVQKFCDKYPLHQNALDIFQGSWASHVPDGNNGFFESGAAELFTADDRVSLAARHFGDNCRLDGKKVLELGPLEGAHSFQLERLGASVTSIEGNAEAYLKCLIVKEALKMRTEFYLGNFVAYLENCERDFDLIFASGVLYHMANPLQLLSLIARSSDRAFFWTHYYDAASGTGAPRRQESVNYGGYECTGFRLEYGETTQKQHFWGGLGDHALWLTKGSLMDACKFYGLGALTIHKDEQNHPNGPCITFSATRS